MKLDVDGVHVILGTKEVLAGSTVHVRTGEMVGLIGPNGSGKSTLLRTIYRHLRPAAGAIWLGEQDVWKVPAREIARTVAAVPQERPEAFDVTVEEVVAVGRIPHKGPFAFDSKDDRRAILAAADRVEVTHLLGRRFETLSGGEKQRALVARAIAQSTPLVILDEPTNHLDLRHQLDILALIRGLGLTTLVALHDLNLAAMFCDRLYVLDNGRVAHHGPPSDVLTPGVIADVFGVGATIGTNPRTGTVTISIHPIT